MEAMPPGLQEEVIKWLTSTILSLFQQFDPHAAVIGVFLTLLMPLEKANRRTRGFVAFVLAALFAYILDAGAPKPTWIAIPAATKGGCVGGFFYLLFDDWLETKLRLKSVSQRTLLCCVLLIDPFGLNPLRLRFVQVNIPPYTQEELETAASESEMSIEEYMLWLIDKRTEESAVQLDQAIDSAEAKKKEGVKQIDQAVSNALTIKAETERLKKLAEKMLKEKAKK